MVEDNAAAESSLEDVVSIVLGVHKIGRNPPADVGGVAEQGFVFVCADCRRCLRHGEREVQQGDQEYDGLFHGMIVFGKQWCTTLYKYHSWFISTTNKPILPVKSNDAGQCKKGF